MTTETLPRPQGGAVQLTNMALAYQTMMDVVPVGVPPHCAY